MGSATITQQPDCINDAIVTATPNQGFVFVNWTKNGEVVSTEAIYTFTLTENTVLVANFRQGTGVEENDVVEGIYPNPTTGKLYIKAAAMQQITVANALGQVMMTETVSGDETMIDMSAFEAGVYMVRVATENGTTVKRVSVIK